MEEQSVCQCFKESYTGLFTRVFANLFYFFIFELASRWYPLDYLAQHIWWDEVQDRRKKEKEPDGDWRYKTIRKKFLSVAYIYSTMAMARCWINQCYKHIASCYVRDQVNQYNAFLFESLVAWTMSWRDATTVLPLYVICYHVCINTAILNSIILKYG